MIDVGGAPLWSGWAPVLNICQDAISHICVPASDHHRHNIPSLAKAGDNLCQEQSTLCPCIFLLSLSGSLCWLILRTEAPVDWERDNMNGS